MARIIKSKALFYCMPAKQTITGLIHLMRPAEWSKSLGNMVLATIVASYVLFAVPSLERFVLGFAAVALLWSGLYALNDFSDWQKDALHPVKKRRPIPSGAVSPQIALSFSLMLIVAAFGIAIVFELGRLFLVCLLVMLTNQLLYTRKPWELKKLPVLDLVSGSMVNPLFRYYAGWVLFVPQFNSPILPLLFVVGLQFGGYGIYRMGSKEFDKKHSYKSSVVFFGEKKLRIAYYLALAISSLSFVALCLNSVYKVKHILLGFLPIEFLALGLVMLLGLPFYKTALKDPQNMKMRKMYWVVYTQNIVFIAGMVGLYLILQ